MNQSVKDNYIHNILELLERSAERFPDRPAFGDPEKDITFRPGMRLPLVFRKRNHLYALIEVRVMSQHSQRLVGGRIVDTHHLNIAKRLPTQRLKALG